MIHNFRNPVRNFDGTIDVEYEHPVYGWIPFTASPHDDRALGREIFALADPITSKERPPPPPPPVPAAITARQARLWLLSRGVTDAQVRAFIASLPPKEAAKAEIEWNHSTQILRSDARVTMLLKQMLKLDDAGIDDAFREASQL